MKEHDEIEDMIVSTLDLVRGFGLHKPPCDCARQAPTYPTYRKNYHVPPCPWAAVELLGGALQRLAHRVALLDQASRDAYGGDW